MLLDKLEYGFDWLFGCGMFENYEYFDFFSGTPFDLAFCIMCLGFCVATLVSKKLRNIFF